jgi:hypothetical protein
MNEYRIHLYPRGFWPCPCLLVKVPVIWEASNGNDDNALQFVVVVFWYLNPPLGLEGFGIGRPTPAGPVRWRLVVVCGQSSTALAAILATPYSTT